MPIRWRLTLFIALVIGAILLVLGLALYFLSRAALLNSVEETVRSRVTVVARTIEAGEDLSSAADDDDQLILDGVSVIVRDDHGEVLQTANPPPGGPTDAGLWREALDTGKAASGMAALSEDNPYYVHAVPVSPLDGPARVVEAGMPYEPTEETLDVLGTVLAAGIGAAFLLSIGGAYLLARAALRPIDAVARAARTWAAAAGKSASVGTARVKGNMPRNYRLPRKSRFPFLDYSGLCPTFTLYHAG